METTTIDQVEEKMITLRGEQVIIDRDLATLYGVETRRINEAVTNNPDKFPYGYIWELQSTEKQQVVEIFDHLAPIKYSPQMPKAFTERGLYMIATILKSPKATATTIAIVEAYTQLRSLNRTIEALSKQPDEATQKQLMHKSGEIISDLLGDSLTTSDTETTIELNFAVLKFKHSIKRK